jgi:hypothetical protein
LGEKGVEPKGTTCLTPSELAKTSTNSTLTVASLPFETDNLITPPEVASVAFEKT